MKIHSPSRSNPRREFLEPGAGLATVVAVGPFAVPSVLRPAGPPLPRKNIGLHVGAVSFEDEGTDNAIELRRDRGAIDTIHVTTSLTVGDWRGGRSQDTRSPAAASRNPVRSSSTSAAIPRRRREEGWRGAGSGVRSALVSGRLEFDPVAMKIVNDAAAEALRRRAYPQGRTL